MDVFYNYIKALDKDLQYSLKYYTTSEYKELNDSLRHSTSLSEEHKQHYQNMLDIFEGGPNMKTVLTVYRGMTKRYKMFGKESFISTSTSKTVAKRFSKGSSCCLYIITLTPGQYTILPLDALSERPDEFEVLLPPGDLIIKSIVRYTDSDNKDGVDLVYCTFMEKSAVIVRDVDINNLSITSKFKEVSIKLSLQSWVDRILDSDLQEFIETFCDEDDKQTCILEHIKTLHFYEDIPQEAIDKVLLLLRNISQSLAS